MIFPADNYQLWLLEVLTMAWSWIVAVGLWIVGGLVACWVMSLLFRGSERKHWRH